MARSIVTSSLWRASRVLNSPTPNYRMTYPEVYHLDEEDAFKKRGTAFENEYIRKLTQELIRELKKKIDKEKKQALKTILEVEKSKLEQTLKKLDQGDKDGKES